MKKIVVVSSTLRKGGNTEIMAEQFARGAREAGNEVLKIDLRDTELKFCIGCLSCHKTEKCVLKDDMNALLPSIAKAEILVFATPVYYYGMSGQMKTFLDRMNPLYDKNPAFRKYYVLTAAADSDECAANGTVEGFGYWAECFPCVECAGVVKALGAERAGDARKSGAAQSAYELGKTV